MDGAITGALITVAGAAVLQAGASIYHGGKLTERVNSHGNRITKVEAKHEQLAGKVEPILAEHRFYHHAEREGFDNV